MTVVWENAADSMFKATLPERLNGDSETVEGCCNARCRVKWLLLYTCKVALNKQSGS